MSNVILSQLKANSKSHIKFPEHLVIYELPEPQVCQWDISAGEYSRGAVWRARGQGVGDRRAAMAAGAARSTTLRILLVPPIWNQPANIQKYINKGHGW